MLTPDPFREVFDLMANPMTSPFADLVTVEQNDKSTEVSAVVRTGDGMTDDPRVAMIATLRIGDLPMRPREQDSLIYKGDHYDVAGVTFDAHGHAAISGRLVKGTGPRT